MSRQVRFGVVGEVLGGGVVDELVVDKPDGAPVGAVVAEGVPGVEQVRVLIVQLVFEPAKCAPPFQRSEEPAAGTFVADGLGEVDHVAIPDPRRQGVDGDQGLVQLVQVDRVVPVDAGVGSPEHDLTRVGVDQPCAFEVVLVRQRDGDLLQIDLVQVQHPARIASRPRAFAAPGTQRAVNVRHDGIVLVVRATKKLLDRIRTPMLQPGEEPTTWLGQWYATALFWRPQVALLVNESTLLPVLMPLAPAVTLAARAGGHIAEVLAVHNVPQQLVADEVERMREYRVAATANRSVVGVMVEFTHLANAYRDHEPDPDLLKLAARLATTPCSPLCHSNVSPDRELAALVSHARNL